MAAICCTIILMQYSQYVFHITAIFSYSFAKMQSCNSQTTGLAAMTAKGLGVEPPQEIYSERRICLVAFWGLYSNYTPLNVCTLTWCSSLEDKHHKNTEVPHCNHSTHGCFSHFKASSLPTISWTADWVFFPLYAGLNKISFFACLVHLSSFDKHELRAVDLRFVKSLAAIWCCQLLLCAAFIPTAFF